MAVVVLLVVAVAATAMAEEPTSYRGAFHFRWRTTDGKHGHIADCRTEACDRDDFARGNLDNAFGLRLGLERAIARRGQLRLVAGGEAQMLFTEYNLSQRDLVIGELLGFAGGSLDLGPLRLVTRARPDAGLGQAHLDPFSGADAFPSGEAAQAFTIASVVAAHARARWVKVVGWGLAGTLAYGRVHLDRRWTSDVVAGALIGAGVGSWVAARRAPAGDCPHRRTSISVLPSPGGIQIRGNITC